MSKLLTVLIPVYNTEKYYNETFSIPLYLDLSKKNISYVCNAIEKTLAFMRK